jgi:hypothetical protein
VGVIVRFFAALGLTLVMLCGQIALFSPALTSPTPLVRTVHPSLTAAPVAPPRGPCAGNHSEGKLLVVSVTEQRLWACEGGDLVSVSGVTTGAYALPRVDDATPAGTWHIGTKSTDLYLSGCDADGCWHDYVHYWMSYDGPYGFHDAPWQTVPFGSPLYATAGSHGCVHLPEREMVWVFEWAPIGTTVTVRH